MEVKQKVKTIESLSKVPGLVNERPRVRAAIVMGVAFTLLLAMLAPTLASAESNDKTIHATGTLSSVVPYVVDTSVVSGNTVLTRAFLNTFSGTLSGTGTGLQQRISNALSSEQVSYGEFTGTLAGSTKGTYATIDTIIGDTSGCPCPPGTITFHGTSVVVSGSGMGGLAGICGRGTYVGTGDPVHGFTTTYDYTFHFGGSCNSNSNGD
jgi:hypothetical protein